MEKTEKNKWLGYNQMGERHNMSSIEQTCINEMIQKFIDSLEPLCASTKTTKKGATTVLSGTMLTSTTRNPLSQTMLERYIVEPMKRLHLKLNYITLSPKLPTPAQKNFYYVVRGKELETQEQNGHLSVLSMIKIAKELTEGCIINLSQGKAT